MYDGSVRLRNTGIRYLNPNKLHTYNTPVSRSHVEQYKRNPGGPIRVAEDARGRFWVENGKHRTIAAREKNRKVKAVVYRQPKRKA